MTQASPDRSILATYLSQGFALLPVWGVKDGGATCLCPAGAGCSKSVGKHPNSKLVPNGVKNASRDKAIVNQWARSQPTGNWGLVTGEPLAGGGFLMVLDVDPRNGGDLTLASIIATQGALPETVTQDSGGAGEHYLFRTKSPVRGFAIGPGLEVKGAGGYILVEPSQHASGGSYAWRMGLGPEDVVVADAPAWLVDNAEGAGEARPVREGDGTARDTVLGEAFHLAGMLGAPLPDGVVAVRCPWADQHSDGRGRGQDSSTVILPPAGGVLLGGFRCAHSHCANRKWSDVFNALPPAHVEIAKRKFPMLKAAPPPPAEDDYEPAETQTPAPTAESEGDGGKDKELLEKLNFKLTKNAGYKLSNDPVNIATILTYDRRWKGVLRFDEFSQILRFTRDPPWFPDDAPGVKSYVWSDADAFRLVLWFKRAHDLDVNEAVVRNAAITVAFQNAINPLTDYLDGLAWDGVARLDTWLTTYLGVEDNDYSRTVGPKWMISACARAYTAGCKADHVLILEGPQGRGKSTALATLTGPDWFADTPIDIGNKDAYLTLRGKWVIELAELASLNKAESDKIKAFFSSPIDTYRPPYGREMQSVPRRCVFAGTVNTAQYLKDETGNRRYWPVACGIIDLAAIKADRDQLWAEARDRYRDGEKWWPETQQQRDLAAKEQEDREVEDPWKDSINEWLQTSKAGELYEKSGCLRAIDITERALGIKAGDLAHSHQLRVALTMKQLGWKKVRPRVDGVRTVAFTNDEWERSILANRKKGNLPR